MADINQCAMQMAQGFRSVRTKVVRLAWDHPDKHTHGGLVRMVAPMSHTVCHCITRNRDIP